MDCTPFTSSPLTRAEIERLAADEGHFDLRAWLEAAYPLEPCYYWTDLRAWRAACRIVFSTGQWIRIYWAGRDLTILGVGMSPQQVMSRIEGKSSGTNPTRLPGWSRRWASTVLGIGDDPPSLCAQAA